MSATLIRLSQLLGHGEILNFNGKTTSIRAMNGNPVLLLIWSMACTQLASTTNNGVSGQDHVSGESTTLIEEGPEQQVQESGMLVYVTNDGDKYHTADCQYSKTARPVKLKQAKADGKTACDICKPSSKTGEKQMRCSGKTAEGKRCQRMTTNSSGKCFQHRDS